MAGREAGKDCVSADRCWTEELPREAELIPVGRAEGGSPGRRGAGRAMVQESFKEDMNWVTEQSFPGRALLHVWLSSIQTLLS